MKKYLALFSILLATTAPAFAAPGAFFGIVYNFGGSVGVSLKALSTNREERGAFSAGVSYFPLTNKFGIDVGAGYLFRNGAATAGWDFLNSNPQMGMGYVNTKTGVVPPPPPVVRQ